METTTTVELPEGFVLDEAPQLPEGFVLDQSNKNFNATFQPPEESFYEDDLRLNPEWINASKVIYRMVEGNSADALDNDADYADYGLDYMGWFNSNMVRMGLTAHKTSTAKPEQAKAMLYLMDGYTEKGFSLEGTGRFFKGALIDPTNLVGLSTLGLGFVASKAAGALTKAGVRTALVEATKTGIIGAGEGAAISALDNYNRQVVQTAVTGEAIDKSELTGAAGIGLVTGGLLGGGIGYTGARLGQKSKVKADAKKLGEEATAKVKEKAANVAPQTTPKVIDDIKLDADGILDVEDLNTKLPPVPEGFVRLYKGDSPTATFDDVFHADGLKDFKPEEGSKGRYWSDDPATADFYREAYNINGDARLSYVDVPKAKADSIKVDDGYLLDVDPGLPNTPAGRTITALNDLRQRIAELVPDGKVVGIGANNVQKYSSVLEAVEPLKQILKEAGEEASPVELLEHFENFEMTVAQMNAMKTTVQRTASELGDELDSLINQLSKLEGDEAIAVYNNLEEVRSAYNSVAQVDAALAATTGRDLGIRRLSKSKGEVLGVTFEDLQKEGFTPSQAMQAWSDMWNKAGVKAQRDNRVVSLKKKRDKAESNGDVGKFNKIQDEIETLEEAIRIEEVYKNSPVLGRMGEYFNNSMRVTAEVMVSNVFSPSSVLINLVPSVVKSMYQPIVDRVFQHGISKAAYKSALAEYSAIKSAIPAAARMAKTAWDLERSMLTGDSSKFLEDQTMIPKRLGGHWLRVFPRVMLASDAFFEEVLYRGFISGQAAGDAVESGLSKGLKGKALDEHIKESVVEAVEKGYDPVQNPMGVLRTDGKSRGLTGDELNKFVEDGLEKYADTMLTATNKEGIDYTQRSLFKNAPSEKNAPSKGLKWYEDRVNEFPVVRVIGQLFTRTPVRVFEEGVRMTPGFQFIHPSFAKDLAGANGPLARVRAQRDVFVGQAITAWLFSKYVAGEATGQMSNDYKRVRQAEDAGLASPYSIKGSDGGTTNFRNLDPFSTPMKITLNALERYEELSYRQSQGEFIDASDMRKAEQWMSVGLGSMYQAVRDANLTAGATEFLDAVSGLAAGKEDVLLKYMGQVSTRMLPNTWYKIAMMDNPELADPKTLEQYLEYRINPQAQTVTKQHTALGQIRTSKNPIGSLIPLMKTTVEERMEGLTEQQAEAEEWLLHVSQVGDRNFAPPPTKNPSVSYNGLSVSIDADLGEMMTTNAKANAKYGQETMYNRWMRYYRDTNPAEAVLSTKGYKLGTASNPNQIETDTSQIVNEFRAIGFLQLMDEEPELEALFIKGEERALINEAGMNYQENTPITGTR